MARRRGGHYTDSKHYERWLGQAEEDIHSARLLIGDPDCYNSAAFHCQQTIEKALKAYILLKSNILVDGHNLTWLCKQAVKYDKEFAGWLAQSASLNRFYIETRYPADIPLDISKEDIGGYYETAYEMFAFIKQEVDEINDKNAAHPRQRNLREA